jgi:hypothetical protein
MLYNFRKDLHYSHCLTVWKNGILNKAYFVPKFILLL